MGFILVSSSLPITPVTGTGGNIAVVGSPTLAPGITINLTAVAPGVSNVTNEVTTIVVTNPPAPVNGTITISIGTQQPVVAVVADGQVYVPARNPNSPQVGEFIQNFYTNEVILYTATPLTTLGVLVLATSQVAYRRRIPSPHPEWFSRVPITGRFSISVAFEQQPTGSIEFSCLGRNNLISLLNAFRPDTRIPFYGYGLRVVNSQVNQDPLAQQPTGYYNITVSLSGANERELSEPISIGELSSTDIPGIPIDTSQVRTGKITVVQLATRAGINLTMPTTSISIRNRDVGEFLTVDNEFRARLRHQGLFADYCEDTVRAKDIDSVGRWLYADQDLLESPTIQYLGRQTKQELGNTFTIASTTKTIGPLPTTFDAVGNFTLQAEDPSLIGRSNVFPGTEITGTFTGDFPPELSEDKQGKTRSGTAPQWRRRPVQRITLEQGDTDPTDPPENTTIIKTTSLNYTNSGPTKVIESMTTENGAPVKATTKVYGFVYLSKNTGVVQNYQSAAQLRITNPDSYWRLVKETTTTWVYDPEWRYELGTITRGRELFAFQTESDSLETYNLVRQIAELKNTDIATAAAITNVSSSTIIDETNEQIARKIREAQSYNIEWKSIYEVTGRLLRLMSQVYRDIMSNEGQWIEFEYTAPDGTTQVGRVVDPNFAPGYFTEREWNYHNSFDSMPSFQKDKTWTNPSTGQTEAIKAPPLTTGRESLNRRELKVYPAPIEIVVENGNIARRPSKTIPDRYTEFTSEFSAEGSNYQDAVMKTTFADRVGRPGVAGRRPDEYEQIPPEEGVNPPPVVNSNSNHIVTSPGYTVRVREQQSYPYAVTLNDAKKAVRTDSIAAEITNPSRSVNIVIPINLQIRPGDKVLVTISGIIYSCRVNRADHEGQILGVVDNVLQIEGETRLQLSPDREPDYTWTTRSNPGTVDVIFNDAVLYDNRLDPGLVSRRNF
jgi:hypothetical protein